MIPKGLCVTLKFFNDCFEVVGRAMGKDGHQSFLVEVVRLHSHNELEADIGFWKSDTSSHETLVGVEKLLSKE